MQQDKYRRRLEEDTVPMLPGRLFNLIFHLCSVRPAALRHVSTRERLAAAQGEKQLVFPTRGGASPLAIGFPAHHPFERLDAGLAINVPDLHGGVVLAPRNGD